MFKRIVQFLCCCCPEDDEKVEEIEIISGKTKQLSTTSVCEDTPETNDWEKELDKLVEVTIIPDYLFIDVDESKVFEKLIQRTPTNCNVFDKTLLDSVGYNTDKELGRGGYGVVYKARKRGVNEPDVAIKVMEVKSMKSFQAFSYELHILSITDHKNIIKMRTHFVYQMASLQTPIPKALCFIVMEYANGGDLHNYLYTHTRLITLDIVHNWFYQMTNALHYMHRRYISHGDFKLSNILFEKQGNHQLIKVTDFGCSRVANPIEKGFKKYDTSGTRTYQSPEALRVCISVDLKRPKLLKHRALRYDPLKDDCWALGICLFEMLFFKRPYALKCNLPDNTSQANAFKDTINEMKTGFRELIKKKKRTEKHTYDRYNKLDQTDRYCLDVLEGLLAYNRNSRYSMINLPKHSWIILYQGVYNPDDWI